MELFICSFIGYLIGSLSPSALLSKIKGHDLRENGTGNLGATNTMLNFGFRYGVLVMLIDALKAVVAMSIASRLFPESSLAPLLTGLFSAIGHMYPFYMNFRGGKGLAAFGGCILAYDPHMFLFLFILCWVMMLLTNHSVAVPITSSALFAILTTWKTRSLAVFLITSAFSLIIIHRHQDNIKMVLDGDDADIRGYLRQRLFR